LKLVSIAAFLSLDFCPSYHKRRRLTSDALEKSRADGRLSTRLVFFVKKSNLGVAKLSVLW
jgi:hypothetical protein